VREPATFTATSGGQPSSSSSPKDSQHKFRLHLASASPRRSEILKAAGLPFTLVRSTFEEPPAEGSDHSNPAAYVMRLAREKAIYAMVPDTAVVPDTEDAPPNLTHLVLGADTIVWHEGRVLGKPVDPADAVQMLRRLRGHSHQVFTGICLRVIRNSIADEFHTTHDTTTVHFAPVSDHWINAYVQCGEPMDKAGAYAAQGRGAALVTGISGDFWNVVGLPLASLTRLLETVEAPIETWW
jgi:septum formation protein